jgi:RNA-directed DNA polymerase
MGTHPISQPCGQFDGEHHRGLRHLHPPAGRRLIDIPARLPGRHREPARQHPRRLGGRDPRGSQVSGSVDALSVQRCWRAAARHDTTILPDLSPVVSGAPGPFQPPVTQRDIKAEVANFVGGVVSPALLNVALHGMEHAAGVRYHRSGSDAAFARPDSPVLIRYADDLAALCHTRQQAEQVKARLASWLAPRGLAFNEDKTRIVTLDQGFDFLGFNVRQYHGKLLIKPSKAAVKRIRERLRTELRSLRGTNVQAVIARLNPIIRGWSAYYRTVVSSEVFAALDHYLWKLTYKWARHSHPNKPTRWIVRRYFGKFCKSRNDQWVFGDRDSGACLLRFSWTKIVRHQMVRGTSSPDDPALASYWAERRRKGPRQLDITSLRLLQAQHGQCPLCGDLLLDADRPPQSPRQWEQWLTVTRKAIIHNAIVLREDGKPDEAKLRLLHAHCHRQYARTGSRPALLPASEPAGLA